MRFLVLCFCVLQYASSKAQLSGLSEACFHEFLYLNDTWKMGGVLHEDSLKGETFFEYLCLRQEDNPSFLKHFYPRQFYRNKAMSYMEGKNTLFLIISRPPAPKIKLKIERNRSGEVDEINSIQINETEFIDQIPSTFRHEIALESCCEGYLKASEAYFVEHEDGYYIYVYLFSPHAYINAWVATFTEISLEEYWELPKSAIHRSGDESDLEIYYRSYRSIHKLVFSYNSLTNQATYVSQFNVGIPFVRRFGRYTTDKEYFFQF